MNPLATWHKAIGGDASLVHLPPTIDENLSTTSTANIKSTQMSKADVQEAFRKAILDSGIPAPEHVIADGVQHRYSTNGKGIDKAGVYCLYLNTRMPYGWFKDYRSGLYQEWRPEKTWRSLSLNDQQHFQIECQQLRTKRDQEDVERRALAAKRAQEIFDQAVVLSEMNEHVYLSAKSVKPYGVRLASDGRLVIPLCDGEKITTVQYIDHSGVKQFLPGGRKRGSFHLMGEPKSNGMICIAEGYATAATIHELTGHTVVAAFDAGNLEPVAQAIRSQYFGAQIIICADDDWMASGNPGKAAAIKAAKLVDGVVLYPTFSEARLDSETDFNDMARLCGGQAVKDLFAMQAIVSSWPDPEALPNDLPSVMPFSLDLLPNALRAWIADIANRMQCPIDFPAVGALVAISSLIGARAVIQPKARDDWKVTPNLWGCIVGRPGVKKSPALNESMRPLNHLQMQGSKAAEEELKAWEIESQIIEMQKLERERQAKRSVKGNTDLDAARQLLAGSEELEPPVMRRFIINDATVEKLGEILVDNPWGVLSYRDELYGLLTSMDKQGQEGSRAFYLQGYDGNQSYTFDRIMRGTTSIARVCIAMIGGIQPGKLQEYIRGAVAGGGSDDGLLQRFGMTVWPDVVDQFKYVDQYPDQSAKDEAWAVFDKLAQLQPASSDDPIVWKFSPQASEIFIEWYVPFEQELRDGQLHPALISHLSKYGKLVPALALIFALIDTPESDLKVGELELLRAIEWSRYLRTHAERMYQAAIVPEISGSRTLLQKIQAGKLVDADGVMLDRFTSSQVARKNWAGLGSAAASVRKAADLLVEYGYLRYYTTSSNDPKGRGRPGEFYSIHPDLLAGRKFD